MPSSGNRLRDLGLRPGALQPGPLNSITDVAGVHVGHVTLNEGSSIRTGVTAIIPAAGNLMQRKVPAAIYVGNGFGKLAGITQVRELGHLETPIILTNTLAVGTAVEALVDFTLRQPGNQAIRSVNALVGETNDGLLNDIRARPVRVAHVLAAIESAGNGRIEEGCVGAGTGTVCFGFKGGIGTSSRMARSGTATYIVGVLVQTNFGGDLLIDGVPVGRLLKQDPTDNADGSCMIVVATDAPMDARNLYRLAKRGFLGLARTGGIAANGSGDYVIAFSSADALRVPHVAPRELLLQQVLHNDLTSPLFQAAIEATEEAILNSLIAAVDTIGFGGRRAEAIPLERVVHLLKQFGRIDA